MPVDIDNRHPRLKVPKARLSAHLRSALAQLGAAKAYVSVSLVDDDEIQSLNRDYRQQDRVTDVLSFALEEADGPEGPMRMLGDIVISLDTAARQAHELAATLPADQPYTLVEETLFLATHGLLHLLGHDHEDPSEAEAMEALERQLMAAVTPVAVHGLDRTAHGL